MPVDPLTAAAEKELAAIAVKGAASAIDRARRWYRSYDLLILGQERAGKTALYRFLRSRLLSKDGEPTPPTVNDVNSGIIEFEWDSPHGPMVLELRNVGDRSGQIGPHQHATMFIRRRPHLLIIVLDVTRVVETDRLHDSYGRWFEFFCAYVADQLMNRPRLARRVSSRLRNMVILLNKADALDPARANGLLDQARERIQGIIQTRLRAHFGSRVDAFQILPCSIVSNPQFGSLNDTVDRLKEVVRQLVNSTMSS